MQKEQSDYTTLKSTKTNKHKWDKHKRAIIGVARILSRGGVHFYLPKKLTTFFSRRPQRPSKYTSKSNPPGKNWPKNWLFLWGALRVMGVHLHIFTCKLRLKKIFFTALGVQVHPLHPLATPMRAIQIATVHIYNQLHVSLSSGVVVSTDELWRLGVVGRTNEVNQHQARLVPWWVTVIRVNHL